jgi:hypothetical protein
MTRHLSSRARRAAGLCLVAASAAWASAARAQYLSTVSYSVSIPTGQTRDFLDNTSWIGVNFDGQRFVNERAALGFSFGFNELYQRSNKTFQLQNGATTGEAYRHLNVFPILVTAHLYPRRAEGHDYGNARTVPYAMLGVGTYYIRQLFNYGVTETVTDAWHFALAPELGLLVPLRSGSAATIAARYNYPFAAGDYAVTGNSSFPYLSFNIGVTYAP